MKKFITIIAIIITLLAIATTVFISIFFFGEGPIPPPEPKEQDIFMQDTPEPSYAVPIYRIPTPQELEERANKEDERRRALEEMKSKTEQQNESIRAEAFRKLKEAEATLLSAPQGEPKKPALFPPSRKEPRFPTTEERKKMESQGIISS